MTNASAPETRSALLAPARSRRRAAASLVVWRLLAAVVVIGCTTGTVASPSAPAPAASGSPGTSSASGGPRRLTPWDAELARVEPTGTRSLASALRLMAMAFGPIPGVEAPTVAPGTVGSASPAVRVVRAHLDELTAEQRQVVEGYLRVPDDAPTLELTGARTSGPGGMLAMIPPLIGAGYPYGDFERDVVEEGARIAAHAAIYFPGIPAPRIRTTSAEGEPFVTFFNPTSGPGGTTSCDVFLNRATANVDRFVTRRALSLDVVHCFQSYAMGNETGMAGRVPGWAWEGPAEYILLEQWPVIDADAQAWMVYLTNPEDSLFIRTYDAVGYYAQAFWTGMDLTSAFRAVLTDVDDPERFALAGTTTNAFLDSWASGVARKGWSRAWDFGSSGLPSPALAPPPMGAIAVGNGALEAYSQDPYTNALFALHSEADLLLVETAGRVRIGDSNVDAVIRGSAVFCTTDKGCGPCPDGQAPTVQRERLSPDSILAVSGGTDGTNGTVSGHPLEEFCKRSPSPSPSGKSEFCKRWEAYIDWARDSGDDIDRVKAAAIVMFFKGMREVAPAAMAPHVEAIITTYERYATAPDEIHVPLAGQTATAMYQGLLAIDTHCATRVFG